MYKGTNRLPAIRMTRRFKIGVKSPKILPASGRSDCVVLGVYIVLAIVGTSPGKWRTRASTIQSSD
jgi:hypothetical protein